MSTSQNADPGIEAPKGFREIFYAHLDEIERRAHVVGLTMTDLCRDSGLARATPDRWRRGLPNTIKKICDLEAVVAKAERNQ